MDLKYIFQVLLYLLSLQFDYGSYCSCSFLCVFSNVSRIISLSDKHVLFYLIIANVFLFHVRILEVMHLNGDTKNIVNAH